MNALTLRFLFEKEKLNDTNFLYWHRNLRIIFKYEGKLDIIKTPIPNPHANDVNLAQVIAYQNVYVEHEKNALLMLKSMKLEIQKKMERLRKNIIVRL
ncbi:hypothetical protein Tco_0030123 [Tanacetum coccineum]